MKICSVCKHTQAEGNFCGKCGAKLEEQAGGTVQKEVISGGVGEGEKLESAATQEIPKSEDEPEINEQFEKVKEQSKKYFDYFMQQLKAPSAPVIQEQSSFKYGLLSIGLYILLTVITMYLLIIGFMGGYSYYGPSFLQIILYAGIFFVLIIGINVLAVFVTSKLFSVNQTFKEVLSNIGGYFAVPIVFSVLGILLVILKSMSLATMSIYIGGALAFGIIPLFVMLKLLHTKTKSIDSFYAFLFYIVFTFAAGLFLGVLIADSIIGELLSYF